MPLSDIWSLLGYLPYGDKSVLSHQGFDLFLTAFLTFRIQYGNST